MSTSFSTGMKDEHYDLISTLYHALQECETCGQYAADAEAAGDPALAEYFRKIQTQDRERAHQAKDLLKRRIKSLESSPSASETM
jgi:hypothetical protein